MRALRFIIIDIMKTRDSFTPRLFFWTVGLVVLLTASACAPAVTSPTQDTAPVLLPPVEVITSTQTPVVLPQDPIQIPATEPAIAEVQPAATSRGPELHATDPSEIRLASGQLQLIEAFNFW